jgi:hypothetical protein
MRSQTDEMAWECPPVKPLHERKRAGNDGERTPNVALIG